MEINWAAHDGDLVEKIVAVLLQQERPRSWRRRASRGDKGVDVIDPFDDGDEIFQVKRFSKTPTPKQKGDIAASLKRVNGAHPRPILEWHLVMPCDQTSELEDWFAGVTAAYDFPCTWNGLTFVNGLAAKYPFVIDYFLRDGKGRLEQHIRDLRTAIELLGEPRALEMADGIESLRALHEALGREDPFFRYDLAIQSEPFADEDSGAPSLVMTCVLSDSSRSVRVRVFAKYPQAVEDRPVDGTLNLVAIPGSEFSEKVMDWRDYGRPLEVPPEHLQSISVNAPGGLGVASEVGAAMIGPAELPGSEAYLLRLIIKEAEESLAEAIVDMDPPTIGEKGRAISGREEHEVFTFEGRFTSPALARVGTSGDLLEGEATFTFGFGLKDVVGKPVGDVLAALEFLHELRSGRLLYLAQRYGKATEPGIALGLDVELVDRHLIGLMHELWTIQQHASRTIKVPLSLEPDTLRAIHRAAAVLEGRPHPERWSTFDVPGLEAVADVGALVGQRNAFALSLELRLILDDDEPISIGPAEFISRTP